MRNQTSSSHQEMSMLNAWEKWQGNIRCDYTKTTWDPGSLKHLSHSLSLKLKEAGIEQGEPVVVMLANTAAFPVTLMALLAIDCNPVLLHPSVPLPELQRSVKFIGARCVLHDFVEGVSRLNEFTQLPKQDLLSMGAVTIRLLELPSHHSGRIFSEVQYRGMILHPTSGTIGMPKFCMRSQATALRDGLNYLDKIHSYDKIHMTVTTPLHHVYAYGFCLVCSLLTDSCLELYSLFNPRKLLKRMNETPSDFMAVVPPMLLPLVKLAGKSSSRMARHVFSAGASCNPSLAKSFRDIFKVSLHQIYGTTEAGCISTSFPSNHPDEGVGKPLPGIEIKIINSEHYQTIKHGAGEVGVKSGALMEGYLTDEVIIDNSKTGNGNTVTKETPKNHPEFWFSGDIGHVDDAGNLHLISRVKEIINVGGSNVNPAEIETILRSHPNIADAAVYPGLHQNGGDNVLAAVTLKNRKKLLDLKKLSVFCYQHLSAYKVPLIFHILDELPQSPTGKCLKTKLPGYDQSRIFRQEGEQQGKSILIEDEGVH